MTTSSKRYSIETILARASQLDIVLSLRDGKLVTQSHNPIPDKAMAVFREYKTELVDYLTEQERAYQLREQQAIAEYEQTLQNCPALCAACLGPVDSPESVETHATREHEGMMYCNAHYLAIQEEKQAMATPEPEPGPEPADDEQRKEQFMSAVQQIADSIPGGCEVHIDSSDYTLADRVKDLLQEEQQQSLKKQSFWDRIEAQNASFDPKKRVDWRKYGYKKKDGKWHYPRKDE
jgi:hypothetical protein